MQTISVDWLAKRLAEHLTAEMAKLVELYATMEGDLTEEEADEEEQPLRDIRWVVIAESNGRWPMIHWSGMKQEEVVSYLQEASQRADNNEVLTERANEMLRARHPWLPADKDLFGFIPALDRD